MQRNMDLIRAILLTVEEKADLRARPVTVEGYEDDIVGRHVELLYQAGYLDAAASAGISKPYTTILVKDLTWEGHEFSAALRNDTVWGKLRSSFSATELGGLPLQGLKEAAVAISKQLVLDRLGFSSS